MGNFHFLKDEYPELHKLASIAERLLFIDSPACIVKIRMIAEKATKLMAEFEGECELNKSDQLDRINRLQQTGIVPWEMSDILHKIRKSGNRAAHEGIGSEQTARYLLRQIFYFLSWFYELYEHENIQFHYTAPEDIASSNEKILELESKLAQMQIMVKDYEEKVKARSHIAEEDKIHRKHRANQLISKIEESEAEVREHIDEQLRDAGWVCDTQSLNYNTNRTLPQKNKYFAIANWPCGDLWADYGLFIDCKLVGVVEAKTQIHDLLEVIDEVINYSLKPTLVGDACLVNSDSTRYKVPFIFASNGERFSETASSNFGILFLDMRKQKNIVIPLSSWPTPEELKAKLPELKTAQ